jgi:Chaperone of endosialidase
MKKVIYLIIAAFCIMAPINASAQTCTTDYPNICDHVMQNGTGYGIVSQSTSSSAIYGTTTSAVAGFFEANTNNAVQGQCYINNASGVYGVNYSSGYGVSGRVSPAGNGIAIYGDNNSTASGAWAANFNGRMFVSNGINVNGTCIAGNCSSDERLKKNIQPLQSSLDTIVKLRPVSFEWNAPNGTDRTTGMQIGFVAQDVERVKPEWVGVDGQGFKTINMGALGPMLVDSVRSLKTENDNFRVIVFILEMVIMGMVLVMFGMFFILWNKVAVKK